MKYIVKLFPEIIIKSKPVRKRLIAQLKKNLKKLLQAIDPAISIGGGWDHIEISTGKLDASHRAELEKRLSTTPGIEFVWVAEEHAFSDLDEIAEIAITTYAQSLQGKTFCVRVKRSGKHPFNSTQVEQKVGGALLHNSEAAGVKLKEPDIQVNLEIRQDKVYTINHRIPGLGGFPMGQQESCISLISGGYDSSVASYLMMKRGIRTHFLFFNLGGLAHEVGVKQVSHYLWERYSASHRVLFITIPFEKVVAEILEKVHHSQMGVILKRMMLRVASQVADEFNAPALVTGECVGQVSSQTMTNLSVIDRATDHLTLRPLITMDKQDIINLARECGSEAFAAVMPEYCGVISDKPTTCARIDKILEEESKMDPSVLADAFAKRKVENIDQLFEVELNMDAVEVVSVPTSDEVVIDIRHPQEVELKPLALTANQVLAIPFFKLASTESLSKEKTYLLYCDKGVMSQLQAESLIERGYRVKVFQPAA